MRQTLPASYLQEPLRDGHCVFHIHCIRCAGCDVPFKKEFKKMQSNQFFCSDCCIPRYSCTTCRQPIYRYQHKHKLGDDYYHDCCYPKVLSMYKINIMIIHCSIIWLSLYWSQSSSMNYSFLSTDISHAAPAKLMGSYILLIMSRLALELKSMCYCHEQLLVNAIQIQSD